MTVPRRPGWTAALLIAASAYGGMLAGVSFLATPVKFLAPSLQLPVALDVGRHTFAAFNKAEWVGVAILLACCVFARVRREMLAVLALAAVLLADTLWLLPALDARVASIIRGEWPASSSLHHIYVLLEVAKFALLITVATFCARRICKSI